MDVREKLVELIEQSSACFECFPVGDYEQKQIEKIANHLIAHGVTVQEWISVKDRLPEDDLPKGSNVKQIKVLTALKSDKGVRAVRSQMRYRMTWYNSSPWAWKYSGSEITHWQYLPQPPKGE